MSYETQYSSEARVERDLLGNTALQELYQSYQILPLESFREKCITTVQGGIGRQQKKNELIFSIKKANSKDRMLRSAQNYIMAGMGLGI